MTVISFLQKNKIKKKQRIFLIEDEPLMAILLQEMITELGYESAGLSAYIEDALEAIENTDFDLAILDVNVRGMDSYEIADRLTEKGIPFIFSTGYDIKRMLIPYRQVPRLQKPYDIKQLQTQLEWCQAGSYRETLN